MSDKIPNSVQFVKGVGPKRAEVLEKLNINQVKDLLYFFPRDYEDRSNLVKITNLKPGQQVTIKAKVVKKKISRIKKGLSILRVTFSDDTGTVNGVWFNQPYLKKKFEKGETFYLSGEINQESWRKYNKIEINNPIYEKNMGNEKIHTDRVVPIYPLTKGINQRRMRKIIFNALKDYAIHLKDILPDNIKEKYNFLSLEEALWGLHFPEGRPHYIKSYKRLAFEEFFLLQLLVLEHKKGFAIKEGIKHKGDKDLIDQFRETLPFTLTSAQQRVWKEIKGDMKQNSPMQRLLQGDVGSGKTVVAILSLLETVSSNYQGIFMAPTEILAEQHYIRLKELLSPLNIRVCLLLGSLSQSARKERLKLIENNKVDIIVGTHALFQDKASYNKIGLIVIDEQHRFGVEQRHNLKEKGDNPDLLVMTATPIPRSLALTVYGDLDLSIIDEMPPGRSPVITTWRDKSIRGKIYKFVEDELEKGRQAYVVCPLIEESDEIDAVSAVKMKENLVHTYLSNFNVGLLHSKLSSEKKDQIMEQFRQGKLDVLVSTTVIEVGVDVPNASIMIIENAERFGLAQLHQLRGRVGRGKYQSYCIMIADPGTEDSRKRLNVMTETNDGFKIARKDLEIRGPGEFFGTKQHGIPDFKVANLLKDQKLLKKARNEAQTIIDNKGWPDNYPILQESIAELDLKL